MKRLLLLDRMTRVARPLYAWRVILWLLTFAAAVAAIAATLLGGDTDRAVLPALVGFLWGSFLLGAAYSFTRIPRQPRPADRLGLRIRLRIGRFFLWLLLLGVLALGFSLVTLTIRTIGLSI